MRRGPPDRTGIRQEPLVCFAVAAGCFAISVPACLYNLSSTEPTTLSGFAAVGAFYAMLGFWRRSRRGGDVPSESDPCAEPSGGGVGEDGSAPVADRLRARASPRDSVDSAPPVP